MSVQLALQGKVTCSLFPTTFTVTGDVFVAFGFVPNAYSTRFGKPSWSKSAVGVVRPVAMSSTVNLLPCQVAYGEVIVSAKSAVVNGASLPVTRMVKVPVPAVVGVPAITPLELNVSPAGRLLPDASAHV